MNNISIEENSQNMKSIAIVGGGIGGLYAAWELSKRGFEVLVFERQKSLGGFSSSISFQGFEIDIGPHYITFPKKSEFLEEMKGLIGENNIIELPDIHQSYRTSFRGQISNRYPTLFEMLLGNGIFFTICGVTNLMLNQFKIKKKMFESSEDYLISTFGKFLYNRWFVPYLQFSFGSAENAPLEKIMEKFPPISLKKIFSILKKRKDDDFEKERENKTEDYFHWYPKFGMGSIINRLEEEIEKNGGRVHKGVTVESINREDIKNITYSKNGEEFHSEVNSIIYATPTEIVKKFVYNNDIIKEKNNSSLNGIIVFLFVETERVFDGWVITVYDSNSPIFRIAQQNYLSEYIAPSKKSLISVECRISEDDKLWKMNDESLISSIKKQLKNAGISINNQISGFKILRIPNLYPNENEKNPNDDVILKEEMEKLENEYLLGTAELDVGRLATNEPENNKPKEISLGGFFVALKNSNSLVNEIVSKFS